MIRVTTIALMAFTLFAHTAPAEARNTPCSGSKGGVKACQGSKFLCQDGSISASKRSCSGAGASADESDGGGGVGAAGGKGGRGRKR